MALFKGSKHQKQVDDNVELVNDFVRQTPFWNYRPVEYKINEYFLTGLVAELDSYLDRLFAGEIDDGNGDVLDNIICDYAARAVRDVSEQKVHHEDLIVNMYHQAEGARKTFIEHLALVKAQKAEVSKELEDITKRLNKDKFADNQ